MWALGGRIRLAPAGIDVNMALVGKAGGEWIVAGSSKVYVLAPKTGKSFGSGDVLPMP